MGPSLKIFFSWIKYLWVPWTVHGTHWTVHRTHWTVHNHVKRSKKKIKNKKVKTQTLAPVSKRVLSLYIYIYISLHNDLSFLLISFSLIFFLKKNTNKLSHFLNFLLKSSHIYSSLPLFFFKTTIQVLFYSSEDCGKFL